MPSYKGLKRFQSEIKWNINIDRIWDLNSTQYNKSHMTSIEFLELAKAKMSCTYFEIPDKIPDRAKRISNQPPKQGGNSLLKCETYPYFNNL